MICRVVEILCSQAQGGGKGLHCFHSLHMRKLNHCGIPPAPWTVILCVYTHDVKMALLDPYAHMACIARDLDCGLSNVIQRLGTPEVLLNWNSDLWLNLSVMTACGWLLGLWSRYPTGCFCLFWLRRAWVMELWEKIINIDRLYSSWVQEKESHILRKNIQWLDQDGVGNSLRSYITAAILV